VYCRAIRGRTTNKPTAAAKRLLLWQNEVAPMSGGLPTLTVGFGKTVWREMSAEERAPAAGLPHRQAHRKGDGGRPKKFTRGSPACRDESLAPMPKRSGRPAIPEKLGLNVSEAAAPAEGHTARGTECQRAAPRNDRPRGAAPDENKHRFGHGCRRR